MVKGLAGYRPVMSKSGWGGSPDTNFVQEVKQLKHQINKAKDKETKKDVVLKLRLKTLERKLAYSKQVSQGNKLYSVDVHVSSLGTFISEKQTKFVPK